MTQTSPLPAHQHGTASDLELARLAGDGSGAAFRAIMLRHNQRLYRVARSVLGNDADAEDVLQEAYLKAYSKLGEFRGEATLATWLTRVVLNEALARLRRGRRQEALISAIREEPHTGEILRFPGMQHDLDPESAAAARQVAAMIERAVDALPLDFRTVFVLRCVQEMSVEETSVQLDIPEATVKTRLHRARRLLRRALGQELGASLTGAFPFAGRRCAQLSETVLARLGIHEPYPSDPRGHGDPQGGP